MMKGAEDRVAQEIIQGGIGAGELVENGSLGLGILAIGKAGFGQGEFLPAGFQALFEDLLEHDVLSVSRLDLSLSGGLSGEPAANRIVGVIMRFTRVLPDVMVLRTSLPGRGSIVKKTSLESASRRQEAG